MLPTMAVDPDRGVIAELIPDPAAKTIEIHIRAGASAEEVAAAKLEKTADDGVVCPFDAEGNGIEKAHRQRTSSKSLRGQNGLRLWEAQEWKPRPEDVYQERLYCIRWTLPDFERLLAIEQILCAEIREEYDGWNGGAIGPAVSALVGLLPEADAAIVAGTRAQDWSAKAWEFLCAQDVYAALLPDAEWGDLEVKRAAGDVNKARRRLPENIQAALAIAKALPRRHYAAPNESDLAREARCEELLAERFMDWQKKGYLPTRRMEPGKAIKDPIRNRGWAYWHQLYMPRQLLVNRLFGREIAGRAAEQAVYVGLLLAHMKLADWSGKLCRWDSSGAKCQQALYAVVRPSPFANYACRGTLQLRNIFQLDAKAHSLTGVARTNLGDSAMVAEKQNFWITDPGYGDMAPYAEYSEFYLAWIDRLLPVTFPDWYTDSKRAFAVELADVTSRRY